MREKRPFAGRSLLHFRAMDEIKRPVIPPAKLTGSRGTDEGSGAGRRVGADERCMTRRKVRSQEEKQDEVARKGRIRRKGYRSVRVHER